MLGAGKEGRIVYITLDLQRLAARPSIGRKNQLYVRDPAERRERT